jgi:uncharacterized protein (DUF427 family)
MTESVWDYPRPPRLERTSALLEVELGGIVLASTTEGWRVLETSHPPTYYLSASAFGAGVLRPTVGSSYCEWKGAASYLDLVTEARVAPKAGWTYADPTPGFEPIAGFVAVMAAQVDACRVDGETVTPQPGGFYGGWITSSVIGPFKGVPGSAAW